MHWLGGRNWRRRVRAWPSAIASPIAKPGRAAAASAGSTTTATSVTGARRSALGAFSSSNIQAPAASPSTAACAKSAAPTPARSSAGIANATAPVPSERARRAATPAARRIALRTATARVSPPTSGRSSSLPRPTSRTRRGSAPGR